MNFLERVWLSIVNRPAKAFLLLLIVFVLGNVITGAIVIEQACKQIGADTKQQLGARVTITGRLNSLDTVIQDQSYPAEIKRYYDILATLSEEDAVDYANYSLFTELYHTEIMDSNSPVYIAEYQESVQSRYESALAWGVSDPQLADIREDLIELTAGRVFTEEEMQTGARVLLVNEAYWLYRNGQAVKPQPGDTVVFQLPAYPYGYYDMQVNDALFVEDVEFMIVGIYKKKESMTAVDDRVGVIVDWVDNRFYMPNNTLIQLVEKRQALLEQYNPPEERAVYYNGLYDSNKVGIYVPLFKLNSVDDLPAFLEKATQMIQNMKGYSLTSSADTYHQMAGSIESLNTISRYILLFASLIGMVVLGLVTMLFMRDRKHEIGIYLALGERKLRILLQVILEVVLIGLAGISFSLLSGRYLAVALSDHLINDQIRLASAQEEEQYVIGVINEGSRYDPTGALVQDVKTEPFQATVSFRQIVLIYELSLAVILLSTSAPLIYTLSVKPKKVLL